MIVYDIECRAGHRFEGWFKDRDSFDLQVEQKEIPCPICGDANVDKVPTASRISKSACGQMSGPKTHGSRDHMAALAAAARELRQHVEETCENVGAEFPAEARRIHYGETEYRDIYGTADASTAKELAEEGVPIQPLPFVVKRDD